MVPSKRAVCGSVLVLVLVGCGDSQRTDATDGGAPGAKGGDEAAGASAGGSGGAIQGGAITGGNASKAGSASPGGATSGGSESPGGSSAGGAASEVDRGWALWTMPNPVSAGLPNAAKYDTTTDPAVIRDLVTGLSWPRALSPDYHDQRDAVATCAELSVGSYDDWRLPTLIEYHSILDWTRSVPAIDTAIFPDFGGVADNLFWTASPNVSDPEDGAWIADFAFLSAIGTHPITDRFPLRCVRGGGSPPAVHYVLETDTVFDVSTGLTWERHATTTQYSSADSATYCEGLALAGKSDWRLPSVGELATLVNMETSAIPMMDREAFPDDESAIRVEFWGVGSWSLTFWGAEWHHRAATEMLRVRCVR